MYGVKMRDSLTKGREHSMVHCLVPNLHLRVLVPAPALVTGLKCSEEAVSAARQMWLEGENTT